MLTIRVLTEADLAAADAIARAAYGSARSFIAGLRLSMSLQVDSVVLALLDDRPVGFVGAINYGPFAYVGTMSVLPEMQRRGIGLALMQNLLVRLERAGCPTVLLDATAAGARLYTHVDFVDDDKTVHWYRESADLPAPLYPTSTGRISRFQSRDLSALVAFDTPYFGADRSAIIAHFATEYAERCYVTRNEAGQMTGYLYAQARNLGPWVVNNVADAEALLLHALSLPFDPAPVVLASLANDDASRCICMI